MPMNIQFFAEPSNEPPNEPTGGPSGNPTGVGEGGTPQEITLDDVMGRFSAEDILGHPNLSKALQSRIDSTVTKALNTARTKWEQELENKQSEAKKLENMTATQRKEYELDQREQELNQRDEKYKKQQLEIEAGNELQKRGLDASFKAYLTGGTAEETLERINTFEQAFNNAVSKATNDRMRGSTPPKDVHTDTITLETVKSMTPEEINANWDAVQEVLKSQR